MLSKERNQAEPSGAAKAGVKSLPLPGASPPAVSGPLHGEGTGVFGLQMVKRSLLWERPAHGLVARGEALAGGPGSQACGDSSELTAESGHLCKRSLQPWLTLDFLWTHLQDDPCHRAICLPCTPLQRLAHCSPLQAAGPLELHAPHSREGITGGREPADWLQRRA